MLLILLTCKHFHNHVLCVGLIHFFVFNKNCCCSIKLGRFLSFIILGLYDLRPECTLLYLSELCTLFYSKLTKKKGKKLPRKIKLELLFFNIRFEASSSSTIREEWGWWGGNLNRDKVPFFSWADTK